MFKSSLYPLMLAIALWASRVHAQAAPASAHDAWHDPDNPIVRIFHGKRLDLWSLRPPKPVSIPEVRHRERVRTPIDRFVLAGLEAKHLALSPDADRRTLIRRVTFDLIGLPPTPAEVQAFVQDSSPDAYPHLVDRLLTSPHYGERWGRHWLDVVRYADTCGFERDEFRPNTYHYRDYVIRAFNSDKPYDLFIKEQLAGDEMAGAETPRTPQEIERFVATGFLRLGQYDSTGSIFEEDKRGRDQLMADLANTTSSAFLGLTLACANCHDHKYDPISQADHFRLRAFFANVKFRDDLPASLDAPDKPKGELPKILAMTDAGPTAPSTTIFAQGDYLRPGKEVEPGFLSLYDPGPATIPPACNGKSTGRRMALASWIASPDNPFTARVLVNRLWAHHFGTGIVPTPNDFGYSGVRPTNQPLLDWMANEFVHGGWSIKRMQRMILLSATYRQASALPANSSGRAIDPENRLLWHQNMRRHDAETLRDSLLAISGLLLPDRDGPPRWPPVAQELLDAQPSILETHSDAEARKRLEGWYADPIEKTYVRTIFLIQKRCLSVPFLQQFDLPDNAISCPARTTTTVAPQALTLFNNDLTLQCARAFADRVVREAGQKPESQIQRAVWLALHRPPGSTEIAIALQLLKSAPQHLSNEKPASDSDGIATAHAPLIDFCRMLLNVNEFQYID